MIILTANLKTTPRRTYVAISGTPPRATPRKGAEVLEPAHAILPDTSSSGSFAHHGKAYGIQTCVTCEAA